jgi:FAD/FMN-containing dehydrogenase
LVSTGTARPAGGVDGILPTLRAIVGEQGWTDDPAKLAPHLSEWRGRVVGRTPLMLQPSTTEQVAAIVRTCAEARVAIVPQGGNTGMCAGAVPDASGAQILVQLGRLDRIRDVNVEDASLVAEAGCVLADVKSAACAAGLYFPLSLSAEGSCQIGGNVATNAGGINVLRYGTMRDLVLGLEAVLPDGSVLDNLRTLRKNTAGYDLKQLFVGSEGTLGIVTAVAVKLYPDPGPLQTAMLALDHAGAAVLALAKLRERMPDRLLAFELIGARPMDFVLRHIPAARNPFDLRYEWYVLLDAAVPAAELESALIDLAAQQRIADAVVAKSHAEQTALWRLRHSISEAERREGPGIKHDISVPVGAIQEFLDAAEERLRARVPQAEAVVFGHVGDGNLHYNAHLRRDVPDADLGRLGDELTRAIYELVTEMGGSISAEHGIGVLKKEALRRYGNPVALAAMRTLKAALDPAGIMNPGKVI